MNKEEKNLLKMELHLKYYKKDITDRYEAMLDNIVFDNAILNDISTQLWITPLSKYQKLQQENEQLKDNWNKLKEILPNVSKHFKNQFQLFSANCCEHILEIMQELEK